MSTQTDDLSSTRTPPKISIIGAGMVGSSLGYTLIVEQVASEVVLVDINNDRAEGEAKDIGHAVPFGAPTQVRAGDYEACRDSDVIVITAGAAQKPGESRLTLVDRNVRIYKDIVPRLVEVASGAIIIVVSNPVDVLTYATIRISGLPWQRVVGSGTILDTARFRHELGRHCGIDPRNVHAYIIGEHGDTEVPVWSLANIAGIGFKPYCRFCGRGCSDDQRNGIFEAVKNAAYEIIRLKGATYFAIALGTTRMIEAILRDQDTVVTASTLVRGQFDIEDVCLSLPVVLGRSGIERVLELPLSPDERRALKHSADTLKNVIKSVGI
ncbi:MAG: L-lactate dehydrogenase [Planctomycetes bacterium DG_58]|nr:MAG: L-lactate dehydrogenase [Planctomycetes bacterium DG_58]